MISIKLIQLQKKKQIIIINYNKINFLYNVGL
jgi:hypothetical protein